jgi:arylsulfatase A-like enzyme
MNFKKTVRGGAVGLLALCAGQAHCAPTEASRPNFLIIMADDLGYGDLGIHGGIAPTPHLDKLFRSGLVLENFMVNPLCSPTRASLLTGCNPLRLNQGPFVDGVLDPSVPTFGSAFQKEGYQTGIFGKWHNSVAPVFDPSMPDVNDFGFDEWVGGYGGGFDYFTKVWPNTTTTPCWYHNRTHITNDMDYVTDVLTDHAIDFMESNRDGNFVCYLPQLAVHSPLHARREDLQRVPAELIEAAGGLRKWEEYYKLENSHRWGGKLQEAYVRLTGDHSMDSIEGTLTEADQKVIYAAMLISLDDSVGRLLSYLKESGLEENTVVWFFSDNGGAQYSWVRNQPLRGRKATIWEGGIHSRAVVRWPAVGWDQYRTFDGLMGSQDVYPTCMAMAGLIAPNADEIDGKACWAAMENNEPTPVDAVYYLWEDGDMIRTAKWKLFRYLNRTELYDIENDPGETTDISAQHPETVRELTEQLDEWMAANQIKGGHLPRQAVQQTADQPHPAPLKVEFTQHAAGKTVRLFSLQPFRVQTGDQLEYDIRFDPSSKTSGGHVTMHRATGRPFLLNRSVDQFGTLFSADYSYEDARGKWAHRVVGIGHGGPETANTLEFVLTGVEPGKYSFELDNIRVQRRDGSARILWESGTTAPGASAPPGISGLKVGAAADKIRALFTPLGRGAKAKITMAEIVPVQVNGPEWNGTLNDLFQNAVVTDSSPVHQISAVDDLFSGTHPQVKPYTVFRDAEPGAGNFVDFHLPAAVDLNRVAVSFSADSSDAVPCKRSISRLRFFAAESEAALADNLIADVPVNPEFSEAYGSPGLTVPLVTGLKDVQFFRMEFFNGNAATINGPRVVEIDGF